MKFAGVVLLVCLGAGTIAGAGAQESDPADLLIREIYNRFFGSLQSGGAGGVLSFVRQGGEVEPRAARRFSLRLARLRRNPLGGHADSFVLVDETQITHALRFRTLRFLSYHENRPVAWRLSFYRKPASVWVISDVDFETRFVEDFLRLPAVEFAGFRRLGEADFEGMIRRIVEKTHRRLERQ